MARYLALDLETTSKLPAEARVTEIGAVLVETIGNGPPVPWKALASQSTLCRLPPGVAVPEETIKLNGINGEMLEEFGQPLPDALLALGRFCRDHHVERLIGHRIRSYDMKVLGHEIGRMVAAPPEVTDLLAIPLIDTEQDILYPEGTTSHRLDHLAADHGFLNPFPHRALYDSLVSLRLFACYPATETMRRADSPIVVLHSTHAFDDNGLAKGLRFGFKPQLGKRWLMACKEVDLPALREKAKALPQLTIKRVTDVTPEEVLA